MWCVIQRNKLSLALDCCSLSLLFNTIRGNLSIEINSIDKLGSFDLIGTFFYGN